MIIPAKSLVVENMKRLKNGETAFAESTEVIRLLERDIARENLNVFIDKTPAGCWFIPQKDSTKVME